MRTGNWTPDGGRKRQSHHWQRSLTPFANTGTWVCGSFPGTFTLGHGVPQAAQVRNSLDSQAWVS